MTQTDSIIHNPSIEGNIPAEGGFWLMILGEMSVFATMFAVFMGYREWTPENLAIFQAGQHSLNQYYGLLNTLILLTSSWFMVLTLQAARAGKAVEGKNFLKWTYLCGLLFIIVKLFEYTEKIQAGFYLNTDAFFRLYYTYTGLHLLHVSTGLTVLTYLYIYCFRENCTERVNIKTIEGAACFWHMVDLLWIGLFTTLYLVR